MAIDIRCIISMADGADFRSALAVNAFEVAHRVGGRHGKKRKGANNDHAPAQSRPAFFSCKHVEHLNLPVLFLRCNLFKCRPSLGQGGSDAFLPHDTVSRWKQPKGIGF